MHPIQAQEKYIYEALTPVFREQGYGLYTSGKQFRLATAGGYRTAFFSLAGTAEQQSLELYLGVRFNMIEELVHQFMREFCESSGDNATVLAPFSRLNRPQAPELLIRDEGSLEEVCQRVGQFMQRRGFMLLEKLDNLRRIDRLINRKPDQISPLFRNSINRCFKATVIARLLHRTDFNYLVRTYFGYLNKQGASAAIIGNYKKMVKFLKFFSMN